MSPVERDNAIRHGLDALHRAAWFEAHDHFEDAWRVSVPPDKTVLQAMVQLAAALLHLSRRRPRPASRLLEKALAKLSLSGLPDSLGGVDVPAVRARITALVAELAAGRVPDPAALDL